MSSDSAPAASQLIDCDSLKCLYPLIQRYAKNGMQAFASKSQTFVATPAEKYAQAVFSRVGELDTAFKSLAMVRRFIEDLSSSDSPDLEAYRYHYENFVFRGTGVVDRAYQLIADALVLSKRARESNAKILERTEELPAVHQAMAAVVAAMQSYRDARNRITHAEAYSDKRLGALLAVQALNIPTEGHDIAGLTNEAFDDALAAISEAVDALRQGVGELLQALGPELRRRVGEAGQ